MTIAFSNFKEIEALPTIEEKHRVWLKQYEGLHFSIAEQEQDLILWKQETDKYVYSDKRFSEPIECLDGVYRASPNKIERHKRIIVCEFDDKNADGKDKKKCKENITKVKKFAKKNGWGYIESTHNGSCNYLWFEANRDLTSEEVKKFLLYIAPEGSEVDTNFASDNKRFPVLFAQHWKYPKERELPVEYVKGKQIDFDSIKFPKSIKIKNKKEIDSNGFEYETTTKVKNKPENSNSLTGSFIFDKSQIIENVSFSCHKINNSYAYGFLLPKIVPVFGGKGKERKEVGKTQIRSPAVITSNGELIEPTNANENSYKIKYMAIPTDLDLRIDLEILKEFLNGDSKKIDGLELYNRINERGYKKFLYFQNSNWYDIHTLWDFGTYFYQLFTAYPLMELCGLSGSAKSKVMKTSKLFTLNPTEIMVNPSEASLFRITHDKRPTKYIDEAEKLFQYIGGQWISSPIVEMINGSYSKGSTVPRLEKVGLSGYRNIYYQCYSPTMIGSINGLRGATETRAITHIMTKSPDSDPRGELEVEDYQNNKEFQEIRNDLYLYAWQNWDKIESEYKSIQIEGLKRRDLQLWKPLLCIAKVINPKIYKNVLEFAKKLSDQRKQDFISEGTIDYQVLSIIKSFLATGHSIIHIKSIAEVYNLGRDEKKASKTISSHIDKLGFKEFRKRDDEGSFIELSKELFDNIANTICPNLPDYLSYSAYSTDNKGNEEKSMTNNKESMKKNEKSMTNNGMTNLTNNDENDEYRYRSNICPKCQSSNTHTWSNGTFFCSDCKYKDSKELSQ